MVHKCIPPSGRLCLFGIPPFGRFYRITNIVFRLVVGFTIFAFRLFGRFCVSVFRLLVGSTVFLLSYSALWSVLRIFFRYVFKGLGLLFCFYSVTMAAA